MWFHLEPPGAGYTGSMSAVAVASQAAGPFQLQSWFYASEGNGTLHISQLTEDYRPAVTCAYFPVALMRRRR